MRKIVLSMALFFLVAMTCYGQMHPYDSLRILHLKQNMPITRNSTRVDFLLDLTIEYLTKGKSQLDTAENYVREAATIAGELNYRNGIANALLIQAQMEISIRNNFNKAEMLTNNAAKIADEVKDNRLLGFTWFLKSMIQSHQKDTNSDKSRDKAIYFLELAKDSSSIVGISTIACNTYFLHGKYNEAFPHCQRSIEYFVKKPDRMPSRTIGLTTLAYRLLANIYRDAGEYQVAMDLLKKSKRIVEETKTSGWGEEELIGELYAKMGNADSALIYLTKNISLTEAPPALNIMIGEAYLLKKDYAKASHSFSDAVEKLKKQPLNWWISRGMVGLAKTYIATSKFDAALKVAKESVTFANSNQARFALKDGYELLGDLFYRAGRYDSAFIYQKKFMLLKDSILNQQFLWKINNYKSQSEKTIKDAQIGFLSRDNQIKKQKLKQQATLRNSLIIGFLLLLILGVFIFRNLLLKKKNDKLRMQKDFEIQKMESEKKQAELHQKALELEMQALRAQMNPHFIFNCLSSINRFIFKNDNKTASDYLTRFSRLIRMVLMHSQKKLISLEDELEMIRLYLDLERLRFKDAFDYSITTTNIVDAGNIFIPPLLLQPFCENAIWHGLMHKEEKGHLNVILSEAINEGDKTLHCIIEDDGVGREKSAEMKSKSAGKEKSLGLKITTERIALLNRENNFTTFYRIEDILNNENEIAGTRVQLKIKFKETTEEYA